MRKTQVVLAARRLYELKASANAGTHPRAGTGDAEVGSQKTSAGESATSGPIARGFPPDAGATKIRTDQPQPRGLAARTKAMLLLSSDHANVWASKA